MPPSEQPGSASALRQSKPMSELALIQHIADRASRSESRAGALRLGIGDDCAILRPRPGEDLVVTTDFTLEGRHFRRDWHTAASAGHRTLARGLSDVAAMGARPLAAFLSLAVPRSLVADPSWLEAYLDGLFALATAEGVPLAGGDTAEAPGEALLADIVLLGAAPQGRALQRRGAAPGDLLYVSGALGGSAAELQQLAAETLPLTGQLWTKGAGTHPQLFPEPRIALGRALLRRKGVTAAMDLSDGLSTDLTHLCEASGTAAVVDAGKLPLHPLLRSFSADQALNAALHGGEDYELLFTAKPAHRMPKMLAGVRLTQIGRISPFHAGESRLTLIQPDGLASPLSPAGWEHLR